MSGHTKGPWVPNYQHVIDRNCELVATIESGIWPDEEAKANARLIAAAPDLLDAAEKTMAWWNDAQYWTTGERGEYNVFDEDPDFVIAARFAIAKAKGEAQ